MAMERRRTRLLTALVLGLLGAALAWATPGMAATQPQPPAVENPITITILADCTGDGGKLRVEYEIRNWEPDLTADLVEVWYEIDGGRRIPLPPGSFEAGQSSFGGQFVIDAPTAEGSTLVIIARAHWSDPAEKSITKKSEAVPLPVCPAQATTTTTPPAPSTTVAVGGSTSTTAGQLPFTGAGSGPALLAGLGLLAGGAVLLWTGRARGGHAS
jgi:hypothetical protein